MSPSPMSSVRSGLPLGLTGAQAATRYVGATASGADMPAFIRITKAT